MNILLVGEYSGLFNCLKDGLQELGHNVTIASSGDGYRNYPSDYKWKMRYNLHRFKNIESILYFFTHRSCFYNYDVVMFVCTRVFELPHFNFINKWIYKQIIKHNKKSFICDSGLDFIGFKYWHSLVESKYYGYTSGYVNNKGKCWLLNEDAVKYEDEIRKSVTGLIPIWYEYAQPYRQYGNQLPAIRIPITLSQFKYKPNIVKDKIVFFHGKTRACKGGKYILEAFDRLREKYANEAEFICEGGLPFDEYMKVTSRANVILDDINSYSFSMNALFAMARGIIYMGGAEPEGNKELGYENCPVINLTKDVNQICDAIEYIIENKEHIEEMGLASRKFVEKYHDHIDIARQYVETWEKEDSL